MGGATHALWNALQSCGFSSHSPKFTSCISLNEPFYAHKYMQLDFFFCLHSGERQSLQDVAVIFGPGIAIRAILVKAFLFIFGFGISVVTALSPAAQELLWCLVYLVTTAEASGQF